MWDVVLVCLYSLVAHQVDAVGTPTKDRMLGTLHLVHCRLQLS